jgi:hypothetical protein
MCRSYCIKRLPSVSPSALKGSSKHTLSCAATAVRTQTQQEDAEPAAAGGAAAADGDAAAEAEEAEQPKPEEVIKSFAAAKVGALCSLFLSNHCN